MQTALAQWTIGAVVASIVLTVAYLKVILPALATITATLAPFAR